MKVRGFRSVTDLVSKELDSLSEDDPRGLHIHAHQCNTHTVLTYACTKNEFLILSPGKPA